MLSKQFGAEKCRIDINETGEKLYLHYPSALAKKTENYLAPSILLEFGGRNITEPNEIHIVRPYLAEVVTDCTFPEPPVTVLALSRTYWEKATLMHVECNRPNPRASAERLSRHWYDLYQLSKELTDFQSAAALELLTDVIHHKKMFFHYGYANYDACLSGNFVLVPTNHLKKALAKDFKAMVNAAMFYSEPPSFEKILDRLAEVQKLLNKSIIGHNTQQDSKAKK